MQLGKYTIENPLILGPMAGVTDWAFRTVCAKLGANITVTEMVSPAESLSRSLTAEERFSTRVSLIWVMTSPACNPAAAAPLPDATPVT